MGLREDDYPWRFLGFRYICDQPKCSFYTNMKEKQPQNKKLIG